LARKAPVMGAFLLLMRAFSA